MDRYRNSFDALIHYSTELGETHLSKILPRHLEEFKVQRRASGSSPHGVNTELRHLRGIFNYAVNEGFVQKSPLKDVEYIRIQKKDPRYFDEDELNRLQIALESLNLDNDYERDAHDLVKFYLYTGARLSEALYPHFTWNCVDERSIRFPKTKTYRQREIPLTQRVREVLDSRRYLEGGPFHFSKDHVHVRTASVFRKAEIEQASTHTLRKTAGAYYYLATRDIFGTSRFLGHSGVSVTETHYVGLIQSLQTEYSEQFDQVLTDKLYGVR